MRKLSFAMNVSLDGYVAAPGNDLGWSTPVAGYAEGGVLLDDQCGRLEHSTGLQRCPHRDHPPQGRRWRPMDIVGATTFFTPLDNWVNLSLVETRSFPDGDPIRDKTLSTAVHVGAQHSAPPVEPGGDPGEATLISWLRADPAWIPELSLVAVDGESDDDEIIGHLVATRAHVGSFPALGIGPVSVLPAQQRTGVGSALMHAMLGAADARGEAIVGLLGDPAYYSRFGFVPASATAVSSPESEWGDYFQIRTLSGYDGQGGTFQYAGPFDRF